MENDTMSIVDEEYSDEESEFEESTHKKKLKDIRRQLGSKTKGKNMKKIILIIFGVVLAGFIVFFGIKMFSGRGFEIISPLGNNEVDFGGEKIQNPLTGEYISMKDARDWYDIRPLAVMVNNHVDARPQSGLIYADLVYEIVAEGGITRLLPFYLSDVPEKIGPVRSTREYYLVLVKELGDAMLMHIGWSPQALEAIESWPVRSLGRGAATFWRDNPRNVAVEHTAYVNGVDLVKRGLELGWEGTSENFVVWKFKEDKENYVDVQSASEVSIDFWTKGDYSAVFKYNPEENNYLRFMGYDENDNPLPHNDQETNEQIKIKNLIVQFVEERPIPDDPKGRLDYVLVGSGQGLVFVDGKVIDVTWSKESRDARTMFYDLNGNEMEFNKGKFWISVVPNRNIDQVVYN